MKKGLLVIVALGLLCMGLSSTRPQQAAASSTASYTTTKLVPATGGTGAIALTPDPGCAWTATSNVSWITITSAANGAGPGIVEYTVQPASDPASRSGTITVQGVAYTITQMGLNGTRR
jgi:hypothetical protein